MDVLAEQLASHPPGVHRRPRRPVLLSGPRCLKKALNILALFLSDVIYCTSVVPVSYTHLTLPTKA